MYNISDTIAAICTPTGVGSIAGIRISGKDSWDIIQKIFSPCSLSHMQAQHGYIKEDDKTMDEVIVLPFKAPNSFTAEDVIEIFTHGGNQVTSMVLDLCLKNGVRLAKNGEFSFRAFINGRIDLTEAEAINDLINASSSKAVFSANEILSGSLKEKVKSFHEELLFLVTKIEGSIEFPMDVGESKKDELKKDLEKINSELKVLIETSKEGQILRDGLKVSIIGAPNAGKSSLLNRLLENERAIVTSTPGTTRDTIEEKINLNGYPIVLVDTAGIRHDGKLDEAEKHGIERSKSALEKSDLALVIFDVTDKKENYSEKILNSINGKPKILVGNKMDLNPQLPALSSKLDILISAKDGTNIDKLKSLIVEKIKLLSPSTINYQPSTFFINQRQKELLIQCSNSIDFATEIINKNDPEDLIADELKKAVSKLDEVSGQKVNEDVINNIFSKFCIGK
jgi:tRNA modification GTPase